MDLSALISLIPAKYVAYVMAVAGVASAIATVLPPPAAGAKGFYAAFYTGVNWVALNLGHATNASAPKKDPSP